MKRNFTIEVVDYKYDNEANFWGQKVYAHINVMADDTIIFKELPIALTLPGFCDEGEMGDLYDHDTIIDYLEWRELNIEDYILDKDATELWDYWNYDKIYEIHEPEQLAAYIEYYMYESEYLNEILDLDNVKTVNDFVSNYRELDDWPLTEEQIMEYLNIELTEDIEKIYMDDTLTSNTLYIYENIDLYDDNLNIDKDLYNKAPKYYKADPNDYIFENTDRDYDFLDYLYIDLIMEKYNLYINVSKDYIVEHEIGIDTDYMEYYYGKITLRDLIEHNYIKEKENYTDYHDAYLIDNNE